MAKPYISKITDLRGKVIGISYFGSTTQLVADIIARQNGLTIGKDVSILPTGDDMGRLVSLDTGKVDAVIGGPPLNAWGAKKNYKVLAWAKDYTPLPQNAVIVTEKKIKQSSDQAKRMIKGTIEGLQFIQTHKKESIDILSAYSKSDHETAANMFESYFPAYSRDGSMTDDALKAGDRRRCDARQNGKTRSPHTGRRASFATRGTKGNWNKVSSVIRAAQGRIPDFLTSQAL
jgi:ABC-type nitrate/sulfonate/bicarbonate transport system substrate-binding protein